MTYYRLESIEPATGVCRRQSLAASSDAQALEQMETARQKHENAGERRILVLYRPVVQGWVEVGRAGSRGAAREVSLSEIAEALGIEEERAWGAACHYGYRIDRATGERFWSPGDMKAIEHDVDCAQQGRRSWDVVSILDDGRERRDVLNAFSAEDAARIAAGFAGVASVASVELRDRPQAPRKREGRA